MLVGMYRQMSIKLERCLVLPVISGSVAMSLSVIARSSQVILVPRSSDVIGAVAVVVTNVVFDSASLIVTTKCPSDTVVVSNTVLVRNAPLYDQRAVCAETLQVKVTVVPLHTSGPASLDRSTAAEAEGIKFFRHAILSILIDDFKLCSIY